MNKKMLIATAAALVLSGLTVAKAGEQKQPTTTTTTTAVTQPAVTQPALTQPAKIAAPATAITTTTTPTTANVGKTGAVTTHVTIPANTTGVPTGTTAAAATGNTPAATTTVGLNKPEEKQEVKVKVSGLTTADAAKALQMDLAKANGVFNANVDYVTGNVVALTKKDLTADKLCTWVSDWAKAKNYKYSCIATTK